MVGLYTWWVYRHEVCPCIGVPIPKTTRNHTQMVTVNEDGNGLCKVGSQSSIVGGGKADADARQPCTVGSLP